MQKICRGHSNCVPNTGVLEQHSEPVLAQSLEIPLLESYRYMGTFNLMTLNNIKEIKNNTKAH